MTAVRDRVFDRILGDRRLRTVFQPIVRLSDSKTVGFEALVRGPIGSRLGSAPSLLAEAYRRGRVVEHDWVARASACRAAMAAGLGPDIPLFLNVEPLALDSDCPVDLRADIDAAYRRLQIVLEVTERSLDRDPRSLLDGIASVRGTVAGIAADAGGCSDPRLRVRRIGTDRCHDSGRGHRDDAARRPCPVDGSAVGAGPTLRSPRADANPAKATNPAPRPQFAARAHGRDAVRRGAGHADQRGHGTAAHPDRTSGGLRYRPDRVGDAAGAAARSVPVRCRAARALRAAGRARRPHRGARTRRPARATGSAVDTSTSAAYLPVNGRSSPSGRTPPAPCSPGPCRAATASSSSPSPTTVSASPPQRDASCGGLAPPKAAARPTSPGTTSRPIRDCTVAAWPSSACRRRGLLWAATIARKPAQRS